MIDQAAAGPGTTGAEIDKIYDRSVRSDIAGAVLR